MGDYNNRNSSIDDNNKYHTVVHSKMRQFAFSKSRFIPFSNLDKNLDKIAKKIQPFDINCQPSLETFSK